jgi:hypothetical protein
MELVIRRLLKNIAEPAPLTQEGIFLTALWREEHKIQ